MFNKAVKGISTAICISLILTAFSSCSADNIIDEKHKNIAKEDASKDFKYPMKDAPKLRYWMELHKNAMNVVNNWGDTEFAKELEKRTGIQVEYIHPTTGNAKESFNIMIASNDLPDIIEYKWSGQYPGGPNAAISENIIISINEALDKFGPNYKKLLESYPALNKNVITDEGKYYAFMFFRGLKADDNPLINTAGIISRNDLLKDLGQKVPETIDEWYVLLKALKSIKGIEYPITFVGDTDDFVDGDLSMMFASGFDSWGDFYVENGKIKYGPMEPERKKYIETMKKWYDDGLIDKNFVVNDKKAIDSNMLTGKSAITRGSGGSGIGTWMQSRKDTKMEFVAAPPPSSKKGSAAKFSSMSNIASPEGSAAISKNCKSVETAVRLLDYAYSEEGNRFYNYGIEGISYKMENNKPVYTDLILKNPDKLPLTNILSKYARGHLNGPFVQDEGYIDQYYSLPPQKDAMKQWAKHDMDKYIVPMINATVEESAELAKIKVDIDAYCNLAEANMIKGKMDISAWNTHVEKLKKFGIEKAIKIKQDALDRYNKR